MYIIFNAVQTVGVNSHFVQVVRAVLFPYTASEDTDLPATEATHQKRFPQVMERSQNPQVTT